MSVHDLKKARLKKNAKTAVDNIQDVLKVINLTERALKPFKVYKPVQAIMQTLKDEKSILESHLKKLKEL